MKRAAPHPEGGEVSSIEKCNDERLKKIIHEVSKDFRTRPNTLQRSKIKVLHLQNIDNNPSTSKRAIQKVIIVFSTWEIFYFKSWQAASEQIGGLFDVICSTHDFSYLANTQLFCEVHFPLEVLCKTKCAYSRLETMTSLASHSCTLCYSKQLIS